MRCINCGWENPTNAKNCEKCNTPLEKIANEEITKNDVKNIPSNAFSKTVMGKAPDVPYIDEKKECNEKSSLSVNHDVCPNCGYPLIPDSEVCPNCNKSLAKSEIGVKNNIEGTIDPYRTPSKTVNKCVLKPITREGEKQAQSYAFFDELNNIKRSSVDPGNMTISSKCQAELFYKDGKWFLVDKSDAKTTFVLAKEPTELKNDDIVLLGDRKFVVEL